MIKQATLIITHYITYLSFQLLRNHRILQHKDYSFLYKKILLKPELSVHGPMGHQNICDIMLVNLQCKNFTLYGIQFNSVR